MNMLVVCLIHPLYILVYHGCVCISYVAVETEQFYNTDVLYFSPFIFNVPMYRYIPVTCDSTTITILLLMRKVIGKHS